MTVLLENYFRISSQHLLPPEELKRRGDIKQVLRHEFENWKDVESRGSSTWKIIIDGSSSSFKNRSMGESRNREPTFSHEVFLKLLNLSRVVAAKEISPLPFEDWYDDQRRYTLHIHDLQPGQSITFCIPLIELAARATNSNTKLEDVAPEVAHRLLPPRPADQLRVVTFPQTRYSFLVDEIFAKIYPLPVQQLRKVAYEFRAQLQERSAYYNTWLPPWFERYEFESAQSILCCSFPIVEFENLSDYRDRKTGERSVTSFLKKQKDLPSIVQWRYCRRFDMARDVPTSVTIAQRDPEPEKIHSARGIYEYRFPDFETRELDLMQSIIRQQQFSPTNRPLQLLAISSMWMIVLPAQNTLISFRDVPRGALCKHDSFQLSTSSDAGPPMYQAVSRIVESATQAFEIYEPFFRSRLATLQYQIQTDPFNEEKELVRNLSDLVGELNALMEVLDSQNAIVSKFSKELGRFSGTIYPPGTQHFLFPNWQFDRRDKLEAIQKQAKETEELYFQINSTENARRQAILATQMAEETRTQVQLTVKAEQRNRAILIFTIITVIFLPLSFFTSYLGMNTNDIRNMKSTQSLYWFIAAPVSVVIILVVLLVVFGPQITRLFRKSFPKPSALSKTSLGVDLEVMKKSDKIH